MRPYLIVVFILAVVLAAAVLRGPQILSALGLEEEFDRLLERLALVNVPRFPSGELSTGLETQAPGTKESAQEQEKPKPPIHDTASVGALQHALLQAQPFSQLVVEVDYVKTVPPNQGVLRELFTLIDKYADKPSGIIFSSGNVFSSGAERYTREDLDAVARANRSAYAKDGIATIYIVYLNGVYADNESALGVAWNASSIAIFKERIQDALTAVIFSTTLEKAVLFHELGHVWGLVNIGHQSEIDHQDSKHPHHSSNTESAMYWAVEDIRVGNILRLGPSTKFDSDDEADLAKIKAGAY